MKELVGFDLDPAWTSAIAAIIALIIPFIMDSLATRRSQRELHRRAITYSMGLEREIAWLRDRFVEIGRALGRISLPPSKTGARRPQFHGEFLIGGIGIAAPTMVRRVDLWAPVLPAATVTDVLEVLRALEDYCRKEELLRSSLNDSFEIGVHYSPAAVNAAADGARICEQAVSALKVVR